MRALLAAAGDARGAALFADNAQSTSACGPVIRVIAAADYSGAVVVTRPPAPAPLPLLHSFALTPLAYAEGTEAALWAALEAEFPGGVSWLAPHSQPLGVAAAAVRANGAAHLPLAFPPLSLPRCAGVAAAGGVVRLPSGAASVAWSAPTPSAALQPSAVPALVASVAATAAAPAGGPFVTPAPDAPRPVAAGGSRAIRVGILGARGFVGRELLRLLARHGDMRVVVASSRAFKGQPVLEALGVPDAGAAVDAGLRVTDIGPAEIR